MIPTNNMVITEDASFTPGVYILPNVIRIEGSNITLDRKDAVLVGENYNGSGIFYSRGDNISIKNISIQRYYWGIHAEGCSNFTISKCVINATHELPANTIFLDIWIPANNAYGGGILLHNVNRGHILDNDISHQMNGLIIYHCNNLVVKSNLANYCSGWGFHLNNTDYCLFDNNFADYCCRYEPRGPGKGHMGADSAGFLIINQSYNNKFLNNYARMGGDGFFLAGMTPEFEPVGCDDNLFEGNDGSHCPNNAFEATFSRWNIFRSNIANYSNYGFWLGFSRDGALENNQMMGNRQAGIPVENGINFLVRDNLFSNNQHGILLWSKHVPAIETGLIENITSFNWEIEKNTFIVNRKAIRIAADQDHGIRLLPDGEELGFPAPEPKNHIIRNNKFEGNLQAVEEFNTLGTLIGQNELKNNAYG